MCKIFILAQYFKTILVITTDQIEEFRSQFIKVTVLQKLNCAQLKVYEILQPNDIDLTITKFQ